MNARTKAMAGAFVTAAILFYVLTTYVFGPIAADDAPGAAVSIWISLIVVTAIQVFFLAWVNDMVGNAVKSALIIAASQVILVDIYYPLNGQRGWTTAAVSAVVLLVGWGVVGFVFGKLLGGGEDSSGG